MKSVRVILTVLVAVHTTGAIVEVISPVIQRSTVPGVRDRVRYVRHIQYGQAGAVESPPGNEAERIKRGMPPGVLGMVKGLMHPQGGKGGGGNRRGHAGGKPGSVPTVGEPAPDPKDDETMPGTEETAPIPVAEWPATEDSGDSPDPGDTEAEAAEEMARRRRSPMHQLPSKVIHAVAAPRPPVYEGRARRNPVVGHIRPNVRGIQRGGKE